MRWLLIALIYVYRVTLGLFTGGQCRFYPSCSHYGEQALRAHGAWRGSLLTVKRLGRCHPWSPGGYDPVPPPSRSSPAPSEPSARVTLHG
jgi:putative membrane protein insertion efficiency factor